MSKHETDRNRSGAGQKTLWFIALYVGGVIAIVSLSYALRALVA